MAMPRKHRRAQWASITEVEKGKRYRIRYWGKDASGEYRRLSCTVRGTRKDAELRRAELMLDHSEDAPCPTVGQAWERWALPTFERRVEDGDLAARSLEQYRSGWSRHVSPTWADVPLDAVRPLAVQQWISHLTYSQAQIGTKVLSAIMDHAVRYEVVDHNPMREKYLMPSRSTVDSRDKGVWTLAELAGVWRSLGGHWVEPAFLLAGYGGCRVGEALGVRAGDVELREVDGVPVALVDVVRQVDRHGAVSDVLKTADSRRVAVVAGKAALRVAELASALPPDWYLTHDGMGGAVRRVPYVPIVRLIAIIPSITSLPAIYLFYYFRQDSIIANGTSQQQITVPMVSKKRIIVPPIQLLSEFERFEKPVWDEMDNIKKQNNELVKQRDLLLPRLLSGKLEVF